MLRAIRSIYNLAGNNFPHNWKITDIYLSWGGYRRSSGTSKVIDCIFCGQNFCWATWRDRTDTLINGTFWRRRNITAPSECWFLSVKNCCRIGGESATGGCHRRNLNGNGTRTRICASIIFYISGSCKWSGIIICVGWWVWGRITGSTAISIIETILIRGRSSSDVLNLKRWS